MTQKLQKLFRCCLFSISRKSWAWSKICPTLLNIWLKKMNILRWLWLPYNSWLKQRSSPFCSKWLNKKLLQRWQLIIQKQPTKMPSISFMKLFQSSLSMEELNSFLMINWRSHLNIMQIMRTWPWLTDSQFILTWRKSTETFSFNVCYKITLLLV